MRLVIYANGQEAAPLFMVLMRGAVPNVSLLTGGMQPDVVAAQISKFEKDPNGVMIATAAYSRMGTWHTDAEAMVVFLSDFFGPKFQATNLVAPPSDEPFTLEMLERMLLNGDKLSNTGEVPSLPEHRRIK